MKFGNKKYKLLGALTLSSVLLLSSYNLSNASNEEYDEDVYGPEAPIAFNSPAALVTFSHSLHTKDLGMECSSCHDNNFEMEAGAADSAGDFTMASFAEGKYCGTCHDGKTAFDANTSCRSCHQDPIESTIVFTKPVKAVIFDHYQHTIMARDCQNCHDGVFKMKMGSAEKFADEFTMEEIYNGKYCGACHDGKKAFAANTLCTTCHIGVKGFNRKMGNTFGNDSHGGGH